jgi:DNA-binding Xre family transcriptional regulator
MEVLSGSSFYASSNAKTGINNLSYTNQKEVRFYSGYVVLEELCRSLECF